MVKLLSIIRGWFNFVKQIVNIYTNPLLHPLSEFIDSYSTDGTSYISFPKYEEIKKQILEGDYPLVQFLGLSGIGKSRLMFEIFKDEDNSNNYYCDDASDEKLLNELSTLLREKSDTKGIIVLDDCNADAFCKISKLRLEIESSFKIVGIYNDPNAIERQAGVNLLLLQRSDLAESVNEYVEKQLETYGEQAVDIKKQIQTLSDGFPGVAINVLRFYKENGFTSFLKDDDLWKRMCSYQDLGEDKQKALQSLSLFEPLGYKQEFAKDYDFIRDNPSITSFYNKTKEEVDDIFETLIDSYTKRELIEINSCWLLVRPLPLAVWLVGQWFQNCGKSRMLNVLNKIDTIEDKAQANRMKRALCKRIENMQENEKAKEMFSKLMGKEAPFHHEEVICSDFGSRLFLSISSVNPLAVMECLYDVLEPKSIEWTQTTIKGDVRRNYIWCLQVLCMPKETFQKAALLLAKLSLAENESWANNATGQFIQLFHVALPGTVASLKERLNVIRILETKGSEYIPATLNAIDSAYAYSSFHRSAGFEQIEGIKLKDYEATGEDILEYWDGCLSIMERILNNYPEHIELVADIVVKHVDDIAWRAGCFDLLEKMMSLVVKVRGAEWPKMHKQLLQYKRYNIERLSPERKAKIDEWLDKLGGKSFLMKLEDTHAMFYATYRSESFNEKMSHAVEYFTPIAKLFQKAKLFENTQIVTSLLDSRTNEVGFIRAISKVLTSEEIEKFIKTVISACQTKDANYLCNFLVVLYFSIGDETLQLQLLQALYDSGKYQLYIAIKANEEKKDWDVLNEMKRLVEIDHQSADVYLKQYLNRVPVESVLGMYEMCSLIHRGFPNSEDVLLQYIIDHEYSSVILESPMKEFVQKMLIDYDYTRSSTDAYGVKSLVGSILKSTDDTAFAIAWNQKMIKTINSYDSYRAFEHIYFSLLPKYQGQILDDILGEMSKDDSDFSYYARRDLGSGDSFGAGSLFQCDMNHIKQICLDQSQGCLPQRLAYLAPVFDYSDKEKPAFSDFFYWLLDNFDTFKYQKEILSSFSSNMGSYTWCGSVVPLLEKKLKCFEKIRNHKNVLVRDWVDSHVKSMSEQLRVEKNAETYRILM